MFNLEMQRLGLMHRMSLDWNLNMAGNLKLPLWLNEIFDVKAKACQKRLISALPHNVCLSYL